VRGISRVAWIALAAAQIGWMLDSMDFLLFTFALRPIQKEFALSSSAMGALTSVALVAAAFGGIFFGRVSDRIGRVQAMTASMLVYSIATAALATSHSFAQLLIWRAVVGIGMGGEWSSGSVLVAETWPAEHRAKGVGLMQSGWAIGAMLAAAFSAIFLERYGWRVLFLIGILPAIAAIVIRRKVAEPAIWTASEKRGTTPLRNLFSPRFLRPTVVATLLASAVLVAYWGVFNWLPSYLSTPLKGGGAGLTLTKSAWWVVLIQSGAFLGYVTFGWIADAIGRRPAFTLFMISAAIVVPLYAHSRSQMALLILGPLVGYFGSGYFSIFGALLAEMYPTSMRGTAQGFCYNAGRLVSAAAPWAIGAAADRGGIGSALAADALFFVVGGFLVWLLPETRGQSLELVTEEAG
jgi:MFS family permease